MIPFARKNQNQRQQQHRQRRAEPPRHHHEHQHHPLAIPPEQWTEKQLHQALLYDRLDAFPMCQGFNFQRESSFDSYSFLNGMDMVVYVCLHGVHDDMEVQYMVHMKIHGKKSSNFDHQRTFEAKIHELEGNHLNGQTDSLANHGVPSSSKAQIMAFSRRVPLQTLQEQTTFNDSLFRFLDTARFVQEELSSATKQLAENEPSQTKARKRKSNPKNWLQFKAKSATSLGANSSTKVARPQVRSIGSSIQSFGSKAA